VVTRADFLRALQQEMPGAVDKIRKGGVGAVDMEQSIIGPGMGVFTRYARVLEDDNSTMSVKTALALRPVANAEESDGASPPRTRIRYPKFLQNRRVAG